jgi:hypothetical protein
MSKRKWTHVCTVDHISSLRSLEEEYKIGFMGSIIITEGEKMRTLGTTESGNYLVYTSRNKFSKTSFWRWRISPRDFKEYFKEIK